jgi:hypothetical protein
MEYHLEYLEKNEIKEKSFPSIWDALKEAIRMLEEGKNEIKGIKCGNDLLGNPEYVLRTAGVNCIWFTLSNCPSEYWEE